MTEDERVLELAIQALEVQQARISQELQELKQRLGTRQRRSKSHQPIVSGIARIRISPNKGKRMSAAQKKKIARSMKARWAKIRVRKAV